MINNIPPTQAALSKHILRASYIACHIWGQSFAKLQTLPPADVWGWKYENNTRTTDWTDLPEASHAVRESVICECKVEKTAGVDASVLVLTCRVQRYVPAEENVSVTKLRPMKC